MAIKIYTKQYGGLLQNIFAVKQHYLNVFGGKLQVRDGIANKDVFMDLKISETDVTIQDYSMEENVGFGTGTGSTNRFGNRKEIKSVDAQVKYEKPLAIHEGVDNFTVNDNADQVIEERGALHAEAWIEKMNGFLGKALSDAASKTLNGSLNEEDIIKAFNQAYKEFVNNKVSQAIKWNAFVNADVYNILVDAKLTTTGKGSKANVDANTLETFKKFNIEVLPDAYFQEGEQIIFAADNVGVAGVGVEIYRLIDSEDFAGVAIQAAGKYAKYIPDKNKKAILKTKFVG